MVGLCGALHPADPGGEGMTDVIQWTDRERRYDFEDDRLWVSASTFPSTTLEQPAVAHSDGAYVWVSGSIHGVETPYGYETRPENEPAHYYCAKLYSRYGLDFASRVNGTFAAVVYDPDGGGVSFVTDRLASHPLFYARTRGGGLAFSTHVQALVLHPDVRTEFHPEYLAEYCALGCVGGVKTPYVGVEQLQPASVTHVGPGGSEMESRRYWQPTPEPLDESFDYFVDRFVELLSTLLEERFSDRKRYGLLLSGGTDSRLLLGQAPADAVAYHLSDWMSREARTAERVALETDTEFQWLRRDRDYHETLLDRTAPKMNFTGRFEQAHTAGYVDKLTEEVDVLVSGLFADCLFRGLTIPKRMVDLGPLGRLTLPVAEMPDSVEAYCTRFPDESVSYLSTGASIRDIVRKNLTVRGDGSVVDHGVEYDSFAALVRFGDIFPMTRDPDQFYPSLEQLLPHWTPFLDNRMLDLACRMPVAYQIRRNVSNAALERLAPRLASFPDAATGVPPSWSFPLEYLGRNLTAAKRRFLTGDTPPQPYYGHHPWTYYPDLIRHHPFPADRLRRRRDLVEKLDVLEWSEVERCYEAHVAGEQHALELYTLLSLLEMRATGALAAAPDDSTARRPEEEALR